MVRIFIVDDHTIIRRGLRQVLADAEDFSVVGEAANGADALRALREHPADVILLDIAMEGRDGLEVLKLARQEFPAAAVLMLSVYPESQFALRAIKGGAAGYLNKGCAPEELFAAIRKAAAGGVYVTPSLAERMAQQLRGGDTQAPHDVLSNREYQVLQALGQGRSVGEIAQSLKLSVNTVSTYRARVFEKLDLHSNVDLVSYCARHQLVSL